MLLPPLRGRAALNQTGGVCLAAATINFCPSQKNLVGVVEAKDSRRRQLVAMQLYRAKCSVF